MAKPVHGETSFQDSESGVGTSPTNGDSFLPEQLNSTDSVKLQVPPSNESARSSLQCISRVKR